MKRKYFGTDGIRGSVGIHPITPDFIMHLGWAAGRVLAQESKGPVIIGKDTRISGYMFESALEAGLSAAGVDIRLLGPMPTPGIAFLTQNTRAQAGIVISASHNVFYDNGIKFFSRNGTKLDDEIELAIEAELENQLVSVQSRFLGKAKRITDAPRRYIEFCKSKFDSNLDLSGLTIALDCAHGATYDIAPKVFEELGATVITMANEPDGININAECGATAPKALQAFVKEHKADVGLAFDGDGDRLIMIDDKANIIDGDDILYVLANANKEEINGAVVGTLMSNLGLELAVKEAGMQFYRTKVGDRYVMERLKQDNLYLGGETSGHIIHLKHMSTGDGIISGIKVLEVMARTGKSLSELNKGLHKFPQKMTNIRMEEKIDLKQIDGLDEATQAAQKTLGEKGRIVLRPSGTEPLIRVMAEGDDEKLVDSVVADLVRHIEDAMSAV